MVNGISRQNNEDDATDLRLVERARRGDRAAFAVLVDRYRRLALSLAWRMTDDAAAAEDVAQDAFLQALRHVGTFRGNASFKTWLMRIVINLANNFHRSRRRAVLIEPAELECRVTTEGAVDTAEKRELVERVQRALAALPTHYRSVVVLREYEDCSYQQMAEILRIPVGTVMSRLAKARDLLRVQLAPYWKDDRE